jgi:hypothetical protein
LVLRERVRRSARSKVARTRVRATHPGRDRRDLDDDADDEDDVVYDDGLLASETVRKPVERGSAHFDESKATAATDEAPINAPKRVPMERSETMRPERTLENEQASRLFRSGQPAKRRLKSFCAVVLRQSLDFGRLEVRRKRLTICKKSEI